MLIIALSRVAQENSLGRPRVKIRIMIIVCSILDAKETELSFPSSCCLLDYSAAQLCGICCGTRKHRIGGLSKVQNGSI